MSTRKRRRQNNPYKDIFLKKNLYYLKQYLDLEKQAGFWKGQGQYWLAKDCERRMSCLLNEDMDGYNLIKQSEELFHKTKRLQW
jgi:hypothetical protein